jgi:hypothetical protein
MECGRGGEEEGKFLCEAQKGDKRRNNMDGGLDEYLEDCLDGPGDIFLSVLLWLSGLVTDEKVRVAFLYHMEMHLWRNGWKAGIGLK